MAPLLLPFLILLARINSAYCNDDDDLLTFKLNNGLRIPLVGIGIGNLQHELIPQVVNANLMPSRGIHLIDTAHNSHNEHILGDAVASFDVAGRAQTRGGGGSNDKLPPLHVVTKVWYTHLGYERTKISVQESLDQLLATNTRQIYVHMLLHWPRCIDEIQWMNCEEEENNLPQFVKDAGPPPHLDKQNAWKDSWRALEELFTEHSNKERQRSNGAVRIASIGVSNFELNDMKELIKFAHIWPHIYQGNSWLIFHDPSLMSFLRGHDIFFQTYAVMSGIFDRRQESPGAFHILSTLSLELNEVIHSSSPDNTAATQPDVTEATILLAYFVHSNIGIIPRAAATAHQHENAPSSIKAVIQHLTPERIEKLERAIPALMKGEQLHTSVSFINALEGAILIHWMHPDTNEEIVVSDLIHPGSVEVQRSHPGHIFVAYDTEKKIRKEFVVGAGYGEEQQFRVEL